MLHALLEDTVEGGVGLFDAPFTRSSICLLQNSEKQKKLKNSFTPEDGNSHLFFLIWLTQLVNITQSPFSFVTLPV